MPHTIVRQNNRPLTGLFKNKIQLLHRMIRHKSYLSAQLACCKKRRNIIVGYDLQPFPGIAVAKGG